jgi:putative phosphoesterase
VSAAEFRVALIADTHGLFRAELTEAFAGVDFIVHAGDVGGNRVLDALQAIAPTIAVSGNVDDRFDPLLPRERTIPVGPLQLHVSHGDEIGSPTAEAMLRRYPADIVLFGHSHKPVAVTGDDGRIAVNPGSAGPRRFSLPVSAALLTVRDGVPQIKFITLG